MQRNCNPGRKSVGGLACPPNTSFMGDKTQCCCIGPNVPNANVYAAINNKAF